MKKQKHKYGQQSVAPFWQRWSWGLPFVAVLFPIVLLSLYSLKIATESATQSIEASNRSAIQTLSQHAISEISHVKSLSRTMSSGSGTISLMQKNDKSTLRSRLQYIVQKYPEITSAFITDRDVKIWTVYPPKRFRRGEDLSREEWYYGVSKGWRQYVSGVHKRSEQTIDPAINVATPLKNAKQRILGVLVFEYNTKSISNLMAKTPVDNGGYVFLVDHLGTTVVHPNRRDGVLSKIYARKQFVIDALQGVVGTGDYTDPLENQTMVATFESVNIGGNNWAIIAQQPAEIA